ncbi:MAG: acyltransferase, partial [Desulfobulbaceae bacterium]|nr:acyltransferase [Desulfobulbaceae bacterium]
MNYNAYRADIDGLRALAVLSVILFHLEVALFRGGFIGVDIFFVISGFLITRLITDEVEKKKSFSFSNFYARRAKRIFPALFFTLWLSLVLAYFFFPPQHYERFGGALLHAISSLSNFYFWNESGYFDTASEFKPLLHTWSLSVEEQFYLFWPLTLVLFLKSARRYMAPLLIAAMGMGSYILNHLFGDGSVELISAWFPTVGAWFSDGRATIFFLTPFRVFEFSIGALAVWLIRFQPKNKFINETIVLLGLSMVVYPILTYTKEIIFPSYNALLPCFGAMLLIYGGTTTPYSSKLLANPLAVHVGLISYSFYLIHWPIIVFYKYRKVDGLVATDKYLILFACYLAAVFMYHFIEQPVRRGVLSKLWSNAGYGFTCLLLAMTLMLPAANIWATHGWTWRFPAKLVHQLNLKSDQLDQYVWTRLYGLEKNFTDNGKPKVLVIGDSMA